VRPNWLKRRSLRRWVTSEWDWGTLAIMPMERASDPSSCYERVKEGARAKATYRAPATESRLKVYSDGIFINQNPTMARHAPINRMYLASLPRAIRMTKGTKGTFSTPAITASGSPTIGTQENKSDQTP
jgi:hypothetical protein